MKGDREGKMNTVEKQCIVHVCSRPAIVGISQSVTLLIRISFLTSKTFSSLYTFRLPVTAVLRPSSGSKFSGDELGSAVSERPVFISILRN
jgi:hypothetical protein